MFNLFKKKEPIEHVPTISEYYNNLVSEKDSNPFAFNPKYANQEDTLLKICGIGI